MHSLLMVCFLNLPVCYLIIVALERALKENFGLRYFGLRYYGLRNYGLR